ncbi:hypothetical protein, partial [Sulfitobacter geojensis]|uniref:hypothetical protein n=1 Tax=Sulfitobacter geojensis TaxID=1342299 RepID=UPI001EEE93AB
MKEGVQDSRGYSERFESPIVSGRLYSQIKIRARFLRKAAIEPYAAYGKSGLFAAIRSFAALFNVRYTGGSDSSSIDGD